MSITNGAIKAIGAKSWLENTHTLHTPYQGFSQGKMARKGRWDTAKKAAACSVPGRPLRTSISLSLFWGVMGILKQTERGWGVSGFLTSPREPCDRGHPQALCLRRAEKRRIFKSPSCWDGGCRTQRPVQWKVWVKMKGSFHSNEETVSSLGLGVRFPPHANA